MTERMNKSKRSGETRQKCRETEQVSGLLCCPPGELTSSEYINAPYRGKRCRWFASVANPDRRRTSGRETFLQRACRPMTARPPARDGSGASSRFEYKKLAKTPASRCSTAICLSHRFRCTPTPGTPTPDHTGGTQLPDRWVACRGLHTPSSQYDERRHSIARDTWARVECQTPTDDIHGCYACSSPMCPFSSAAINSRQPANNCRLRGAPGTYRNAPLPGRRWAA